MKRKIIASLLTVLLIIGVAPVGVSAEWRQNEDSSWSWIENSSSYYEGWKQIDGKSYYFNNWKMQTGWAHRAGYTGWYYFGNDGAMQTGYINNGGKLYYLKDDGLLAQDTVINGLYSDSDGVVQPIENHKVLVDNKYVKITYLGVDKVGSSYKKVEVQIENKSNQELVIETDNVTIDGFKPELGAGGIRESVAAGKTLITSIKYYSLFITTNFDSIDGDIKIEESSGVDTIKQEHISIHF